MTKAIPPEPFVLVQGGPQFDEAELPSLRGRAAKLFPGLAKWPVEKWLVAPAIIFIAASLIYRIAFDLTIDLVAK